MFVRRSKYDKAIAQRNLAEDANSKLFRERSKEREDFNNLKNQVKALKSEVEIQKSIRMKCMASAGGSKRALQTVTKQRDDLRKQLKSLKDVKKSKPKTKAKRKSRAKVKSKK